MLIGRSLLLTFVFLTFILAATTTNIPTSKPLLKSSSTTNKKFESSVILNSLSTSVANQNECQEPCSIDYCLKYKSINSNCTRLILDQCNCCIVCLRSENQICGGHLNVYGLCEPDLLCYKPNKTSNNPDKQTGICVKACLKFQCLLVNINNKTKCECADRRVPCNVNFQQHKNDDNKTRYYCEQQTLSNQERELSLLKTNDVNAIVDCSNVVCDNTPNNAATCPLDSHFIEDSNSLSQTSLSSSNNLSSICCKPRGQCVCSTCPKTICGENSIIQIYRTGNQDIPGQCCDQFICFQNSQQCHHDKKNYNENETWSIDECTTCTCRSGLVDCTSVQCPIDTHCGYMYKPENECCPRCGGCLDDRSHVQQLNSTWTESNGCMRCWCENGRSRCIAEGCIAPPCENPRQIANVCCPVCDDLNDDNQYVQTVSTTTIVSQIEQVTNKCPPLDKCFLVCEYGLAKDEKGCLQCACSTMSCPSPLCILKVNRFSKQYCSCASPFGLNCKTLNCDKHCPYSYSVNKETGCLMCQCNPCPSLICTKNCTYGLKRNEVGCPICVCGSSSVIETNNKAKQIDLLSHSWSRKCHSGSSSYSNGEIWFDGCRQCLCHRGEQLCALISCPILKCSQPIRLPDRCCPTCPETPMLPEPLPSSQVCYASQYVTGEELEFDTCTKCTCLHNIAFCSVSLCPPPRCSSPIYDASLCCPICPPEKSKTSPSNFISNLEEDVCILENGMIKHTGELWKHDDCKSCLCPRGKGGQIECFSQTCDQNLPCSNPILKKGQCCPFCLPPTAAVAVCIFNHVQYRSGEHWNVSECHHCECSYGTIVCHQHKCPPLNCVQTVTLSGHCCPICRDQLSFIIDQDKLRISQSRFGFTIIIIFSTIILILVCVIIALIFILLYGRYRSLLSSDPLSAIHHRAPVNSQHSTVLNSTRPSNIFSYVRYDLMSRSNDTYRNNTKQNLAYSRAIPLPSAEQISTYSIIETNTTTMGTSSSNNELEPNTWTEDDVNLQCSACSSNDDEEVEEHETISSDNDESHQQLSSHPPIQMVTGPPTIIYV